MTDFSPFDSPDQPWVGLTGSPLDRADHLRRDAGTMVALRSRPDARWLVLDDLKPVLTKGEHPDILWAYRSDVPHDAVSVFLGLAPNKDGGAPRFAAAAPAADLVTDFGGQVVDARAAAAMLGDGRAQIVAQARSLLDWHARHQFCAACGARTVLNKAGYARSCQGCNAEHFPRTDPVVIMLVTHGNSVLLGRSPAWPEGMFSLLAGFIEPGETIEAAVRREVFEESGVRCGPVSYLASQPWPFPASLMIGARTEALDTKLTIDPDEIEQARWVSREELVRAFAGLHPDIRPSRPGAIAHFILRNWLADTLD